MRSSRHWSARAVPESVGRIRGELARFVEGAGVGDPPLGDVKLAVSEALTNVVVHSYRGSPEPGMVEIDAEVAEGELRIKIADEGDGMRPRTDSPGAGLGLPIIASLAGGFEIHERQPQGTELLLSFAL